VTSKNKITNMIHQNHCYISVKMHQLRSSLWHHKSTGLYFFKDLTHQQ